MIFALGSPPRFLSVRHESEDVPLSPVPCKDDPSLAGGPCAGACRDRAAAGASPFLTPPPQTGRQPLAVARSEGAAGSAAEEEGSRALGDLAPPHSPGRPPRFHLRCLRRPPRGLIRRGCAWRTLNIWSPARPLPRPAPPRPSWARQGQPCGKGLQPTVCSRATESRV